MGADVSRDCVEHTGRISKLEALSEVHDRDERDQWNAINGLRDDLGETKTNSALTLQLVQKMAEDLKEQKEAIRVLTEEKNQADGERRRTATVVGALSAVASGVGTWAVTHWMGAK